MRKKPDITPPENILPRTLDLIEQKRKYELITPLYGGGVEANKPDPVTIVRATEIRGQLRFWWRAMRGGQAEGDPPLKTREDEIWGKAYEKGDTGIPQEQTIQIIVDADPSRRGKAIKPFEIQRRRPKSINGIPDYAAFPLQPDQKELQKSHPPIPDLWEGICFTLTITYPARLSKEIEAALWAWETFGGLGARTRRGFGALHLLEINGASYQSLPTSRDVERWIQVQAREHSRGGSFPLGAPHLSSTLQLAVTPPLANPVLAWRHLIGKLQDFRQQKDVNRRSAWPEADTIREVAGTGSASQIQKFPRAAFGLPIIFHFTGNNAPAGNYTLNETETERKDRQNKERFASPLILRPLLCSDKQAVGLALLLEGSRVELNNLVLQDDSKDKKVQKVNGTSTLNGVLDSAEARAIAHKSSGSQDGKDALRVLRNETDVLQAFMKFCNGV